MRVALFTHGGVGRPDSGHTMPALVNLISRLSGSFDISVFTPSASGRTEQDYRCGDAIVKPVPCLSSAPFPVLLTRMHAAFRKEHRRSPFSLLNGFWAYPAGTVAVILSALCRMPAVISVRGGDAGSVPEIGYGLMRHPVLKRVALSSLKRADAVIVSTIFQLESLKRHGLKRPDTRVIPSGVSGKWLIAGWERVPSPPFTLIHVANLTEVKDQQTLVLAFAQIRRHLEAELIIIGPDYLGGRIQRLVAMEGLSPFVRFTGFLDQDQVRAHLARADLMLHSSLFEGQGLVLAEAAATGVVLCATDTGLAHDLGPDTAKLSPPGDPDALAANAVNVLKNPREFATLQARARRWAELHTIDWTALSYKQLYEELTGR